MMSNTVWLIIGGILIVEGVGPLIVPSRWRDMMTTLSGQNDNTLRRIGGCLVVAGLVICGMML